MSYLNKHNPQIPTQQEPLDARQVENAAGGYVYPISEFDALMRFLVLGTQGGSIYESEKELTKQNFENIIKAIQSDGPRVVEMVLDVSEGGKARKNDMALFVLVLCMKHGDADTKQAVERVYNRVARTGTHHLMWCNFIENMPDRGWGRAVQRIVANWYESKDEESLAYQVVKYRNREGFSHQKALHRCHGGKNTPLYRWLAGRDNGVREVKRGLGDAEVVTRYGQATPPTESHQGIRKIIYPRILQGFMQAQELGNSEDEGNQHTKRICSLIEDYGLTHEMIPNEFLKSPDVWEALLEKMPLTATLRNLGRMTSLGILEPFSENVKTVLDKFTKVSVRKARLHPLTTLIGLKTYDGGKGVKGSLTWKPNIQILSHLQDVFYWGFETIEPTGKNLMLALDTSGSMFGSWSGIPFAECPNLDCGEIAAVMAMATARVEPNHVICAFDDTFTQLSITDKSSLPEVMRIISDRPHGATDCSLPMTEAYRRGWRDIDAFVIYTDNETWHGDRHPVSAMRQFNNAKQKLNDYRNTTGTAAKLVSVSMLASDTTIIDPFDENMLDFVGMSTDTPRQVAMFLNGEI